MKKVSIIVPVYKTEKYLNNCIESIISQTYKNIEIILIDDGSTDKCPQMCDEWAKKDNRVIVIHKENGGVSCARNTGIASATGDYISFIDSDDYINENMIMELVNSLEKNNADISICNFYPNDDFNLDEVINIKEFYNLIFNKKLYRGYLWNKLYKNSIIKQHKIKFDNNIHICEDLLFNCQYASYCQKASYNNKKLYYYNDDSISALTGKLNERYISILDAYEEIYRICEKTDCDMNIVKISYFKVITDIIYRNHISNNIYSMKKLKSKKNLVFKSIDKKKLSLKNKIELYIYNYFPIITGNIRRKLKRRRK